MKLPNEIGPIHFVGIGGIGMSGIAEVLINLGHAVQGSDASDNANVKRLREHGANVFVGHDAANLGDAAVVVVSTAIKRDNPELASARAKRIPVVRRAEMLAELMRLKSCVAVAGTHGKTTTTSLVATLLEAAGLDPTVINGGIINAYGANARLGGGDWMVVEADESDGTFLKLPADVAIVTNIDPEHLDHFKTFDAIKDAFLALIENLPFYGFAVMCLDHPTVQELVGRIEDRRVFTYGENPQADVRLLDVEMDGGVTRFAVLIRERATGAGDLYRQSGAADAGPPQRPQRHRGDRGRASARRVGRRHPQGDRAFGGVKRRFTRTGNGTASPIYDDYGHHPVEIAAVLKAARGATTGKVIAIVQPHRYSRLPRCSTPSPPASTTPTASRRRRLSGRRSADRGSRQGASRRRHRRARPSPRACAALARAIAPAGAGARHARRHRRLPRRRHGDPMGLCAAGRTRGRWTGEADVEDRRCDPSCRVRGRRRLARRPCRGRLRARLCRGGRRRSDRSRRVLSADLLVVLGGPIGVYETDAYPFLVAEIETIRRRLERAEADPRRVSGRATHGGGARRARRSRPGQGDRLCAGRTDRRRPRLRRSRASKACPCCTGTATIAACRPGAERLASTDSVPDPGVPRSGRGARPAVPRRGRPAADRSVARRPHGRTRQGRHRSARPSRRRAATRRGDRGGGPGAPVGMARGAVVDELRRRRSASPPRPRAGASPTTQPLAPCTWFRVGGAARSAVLAGRRGRPRAFPGPPAARPFRSPSSASART